MRTTIFCLLSAVLASAITGIVVYNAGYNHALSKSMFLHEQEYNQSLQKSFEFSNGFKFQVEDIRIRTFSEGRPWTRIIGRGNRPDVPMSLDLIDETGESILTKGARRTPLQDPDIYHYETFISFWTNSPELRIVTTIFPNDDTKKQMITHAIPNPIHFHRLFDLDLGAEGGLRTRSIGSRSVHQVNK